MHRPVRRGMRGLALPYWKTPLLRDRNLSRELCVEGRIEFCQGNAVDELELQCSAKGWELPASFVLRDSGEGPVTKECSHAFLRVAGAFPGDPQLIYVS